MLKQITHSSVFVFDQEEALDFYVGKLGMEVRADVDMEIMRWLTIGVPGNPDMQVLLEVPMAPFIDDASIEQIKTLLSKGAMGLGFIITTDDCRAEHRRLVELGVEFTEEPVERFYGIDCGLRDPFGNHLRMTEPAAEPLIPPPPGERAASIKD